MKRLQHAAIIYTFNHHKTLPMAPTMINTKPRTHPLSLRTYGSDSTPDPMADAQREKILPLKDPLSSLPKALLINVFLPPGLGEKIAFPSLMLMSPVAACIVFGEKTPEIVESIML